MGVKNILAEKITDRDKAEITLTPGFPEKRFSVELTNICNHTCLFCPHHNRKMTRKHGIIDEQFFRRIVAEAYELGSREICIGANGETFVVKNLAQYVKFAKEVGYSYVFINTNGALATPERMKEVMDAGLDSVRFSINAGNRETYKLVHGKDEFEKVKENLYFCLNYRKESKSGMNIFLSFVVNKYNISEIGRFKDEFLALVDEIVFMRVRNIGGYMPEIEDMINDEVLRIPESHQKCVFPFNGVMVTWEGYLTACCLDWQNYLAVSDLNKTSLYEAWNGENMKKLRQRFIDNNFEGTICQLCKGRKYSKPEPLVKELFSEYEFE
jgi:MoaA/NifB/PqqE/SkfB family radical SAM enzyme